MLRDWGDRKGVAALEFALVLPVLIALTFGVYQLSEGMILYQQVYSAAHSIAASASSLAIQGDGSTALTYAQVQFEASTIFAEIPALRAGSQTNHASDGVTISSVVFEPTSPGCMPSAGTQCSYSPNVVWSVAYTGGDSGLAPYEVLLGQGGCHPPPQAAPGQVPAGSLPTLDLTTDATAWPPPILVVDAFIGYQPVPLIDTSTPIEFLATGFWPVRSVKAASLDSNGNATPLLPDQQYTTLTGTSDAQPGSFCVNSAYPEPP